MADFTPEQQADFTPEQQAFLADHLAHGYEIREKRRQVLHVKQTTAMIIVLGREATDLDDKWRTRRQEVNSERQALLREKTERQGALSRTSYNIKHGIDDLAHALTDERRAEYTQMYAKLSGEYDRFEDERKEKLKANREELAEIDEERHRIAKAIEGGTQTATLWVVDLERRDDGARLLIRLDNGEIVDRRKNYQEGKEAKQIDLFGSDVADEPLTEIEYVLALRGRTIDAAASYAKRHDMTASQALVIVCRLAAQDMPDDELPPEAGERPASPPPTPPKPVEEPMFWDVIVREYEPTDAFHKLKRKITTEKPNVLAAALKQVPEVAAILVRRVSKAMAESHVAELVEVGAQAAAVPHVGKPV